MEPEAAAAGTTGPGNTRLQRRRRGVIHRPEVGFFKGGGGGGMRRVAGSSPPPGRGGAGQAGPGNGVGQRHPAVRGRALPAGLWRAEPASRRPPPVAPDEA